MRKKPLAFLLMLSFIFSLPPPVQAVPEQNLTIHYQRSAKDCEGWGLHLWNDPKDPGALAPEHMTTWQKAYPFNQQDQDCVSILNLQDANKPFGFLLHKGDLKDVYKDRFFTPKEVTEIWLVQGDEAIYPNQPPATTATIHYIRPDGNYTDWKLHLWGNGVAEVTPWQNGKSFEKKENEGIVNIKLKTASEPVNFIIHKGETKDVGQDRFFVPTEHAEIWLQQDDAKIYYQNPLPPPPILGALYTPQQTTFSLWSPDTSEVKLWLDDKIYSMSHTANDNGYTEVYSVTVPGDFHLKKYHFLVNGKTVRDPYGVMVEPNTDNNIVLNPETIEPEGGWAPHPPLAEREDAIIYETHVRDFTIDSTSGVTPEKRGKFMGMVEKGTTYQGKKTGLDHLLELGITHVQLLPIYDFNSCADLDDNTCYTWGYDPRNYNVPEERYSLTPTDYEGRTREFKTMINEFHKAGLRVIMDVVYNHTYDKKMLADISSKYYLENDLSGVGNTLNATEPMVSRMIRDSLEYWVKEYHLDGFRFDLIGVFDYTVVGEWGRYLNTKFPDRNLLVYGEPWNGFASDPREGQRVRLGTVACIADAHVGVFNPRYREAIKGQNDHGEGGGMVFNQGDFLGSIQVGSRGGIQYSKTPFCPLGNLWDSMFAADPEQTINYVSAHDNLTLWDKIQAWAKLNQQTNVAYLKRIDTFANSIILTSQGIPFIHGGEELLRTKQGERDSYNKPDSINKIDWQWKVDNQTVFDYYKSVIALRKAHPGLRMNTWDEINNNIKTSTPRYGVVVHHINAAANGDAWKEMIVIDNSADHYTYPLPPGIWHVALEKADSTAGQDRSVSGNIVAEGTAVTVLYQLDVPPSPTVSLTAPMNGVR